MKLLDSPASRSILFYGVVSLFSSLLGKIVITKFFFDYPIVILMLQNAAALFFIEVLRVVNLVKIPPYSFDKGRHLFIPSILLSIAGWLSVASFEGIGMPAFDAIKRFTPLFAVIGSGVILRKQRVDQRQIVAIIGLCVAASVCVNFELSLDRFSLFYGVISAALQATAFLQLESLSISFQPLELLYMHSFNSLVVFLLADIVQDEIRDAFMYMMTSANVLFSFVFFILLVAGVALQYTTIYCISTTGAVTTTLVGNVRSAVQIMVAYYCGVYLFYDVTPLFLNWIGLIASIGAAAFLFQKGLPTNTVNEKQFGALA